MNKIREVQLDRIPKKQNRIHTKQNQEKPNWWFYVLPDK